jgi:monoamine oxidase
MNRRDLLKQGASLAMLTAMASQSSFAVAATPKRIIVIGAGMAGLAAAKQLKAQGHTVTVLEGRTRIGGRTWTSQVWPDAPVDLGASWIHETQGNPLTPLAQQAGAQLITTSYDSAVTYDTNNQPISAARKQLVADWTVDIEDAIFQGQKANIDKSVRATVESYLDWATLSVADQELCSFVMNATMEQEYAGSRNTLSTYWFDSMSGYNGEDAVFAQGYKQLVDFLATGLNISLGQKVTAIDSSTALVKVTTDKGSFTADKVIVTVPLGVLQKGTISFKPALSTKKQNAISRLGMGNFNKCYLRFPTQFWPQEDWLESIPTQAEDGQWSQWLNLGRLTGQPILMGFNAADFGHTIEAWTDAQILTGAMTRLRKMFGAGIPDPISYQLTRWDQDPFSCGAYSFNKLGSTPSMRDDLAANIAGRVYFAGEATNRNYFATAHGAYLSGQKAATLAGA